MTTLNRKQQVVFTRMSELLAGFGLDNKFLRALSCDIVRHREARSKPLVMRRPR
jgi:hypothetical protein